MSEALIIADKSDLVNIADAVREQTGETDLLSLDDIANEIRTLSQASTNLLYFFSGFYQPFIPFSDSSVTCYLPHASFTLNCLPKIFANNVSLICTLYLFSPIFLCDSLKLLFQNKS